MFPNKPKRSYRILATSLWSIVVCGCAAPQGSPGTTVTGNALPTGEPTLLPRVVVDTTMGRFVIELDAEKAPVTATNFVDYVQAGFYNGTLFHRILRNAMIQGGYYTANMERKIQGLRPPIPSEWNNGLTNSQWTLGMVRKPGILQSATSQFYINVYENDSLDMLRDGAGYTVFGRVVDGFEILERMRDVRLGPHPKYAGGQSAVVPLVPVVIRSMRMLSRLDREAAQSIARENQKPQPQKAEAIIRQYVKDSGNKAVKTQTGLIYVDLQIGEGKTPIAEETVEIFYRGVLVDGREFESSMDDSINVKVGNMISGLQEGLLTMREGGKRALIVPPELGYGEGGVPGRIPPHSVLIYEIEMLQIVPEIPKLFVPGKRNTGR